MYTKELKMKKYDVAIVGAGPAGLFCAYELIEKNNKLKIALIDKGRRADTRMCPMKVNGGKCLNCNPCQIMSGYGGAGTFSDGKLNFIPKLGKSDLFKYMSQSEAYKIIDDTEEIFTRFKMDSEVYPSNMDEAEEIKKEVAKTGARLLLIKQKHLGSDKLPTYIKEFTDYLENKGVDIYQNADVLDIVSKKKNEHELIIKMPKKDETLVSKNVVVAPGRTGAKWIQELADKYNIPYTSQSIEIGVRVEVRKEILEDITNVIYDPTIFIKTDTYTDEIRTQPFQTVFDILGARILGKEHRAVVADAAAYPEIFYVAVAGNITVIPDGYGVCIAIGFISVLQQPEGPKHVPEL